MTKRKRPAVKISRAVLAKVVLPLVVLIFFPSLLHATFKISRPYPLPPEFAKEGYTFPAVAYGGGVYLVYYSFCYVDTGTLFPVWSQCMVSRVSPSGQVLDSIPIPITLKTSGWKELSNYSSTSPPAFHGSEYFLLWNTGSLGLQDTNVILGLRLRPDGTFVDSTGISFLTKNSAGQDNFSMVFGDSLYLLIWVDYRNGKNWIYGTRIRPNRSAVDPDGFKVNQDTTKPVSETSLAYSGQVFLSVWTWNPDSDLSSVYVSAARVREDGVVLDTVPIPLTRGPASRQQIGRTPMAVWDGNQFFVAFMYEDTLQASDCVAGVRVTASGAVLDSIPIRISRHCGIPTEIGLAFNGTDYQVLWVDGQYVCGSRVSPSGIVKDTLQNPLFPFGGSSQQYPSVVAGLDGKVLATWNTGTDVNIYGGFLDTTGREVGVAEMPGPSEGESPVATLSPPYPNPMRDKGDISFALPALEKVRLAVYDALGRKVKELLDGSLEAGAHRLQWDGRDEKGFLLPPGVYFLRLEAGKVSLFRKLVVIR